MEPKITSVLIYSKDIWRVPTYFVKPEIFICAEKKKFQKFFRDVNVNNGGKGSFAILCTALKYEENREVPPPWSVRCALQGCQM
jgi:hypothetical protein